VGTQARKGRKGRTLRLAAGWILTVAGAILGPVPVLPGVALLVPGIAILCAESRWVRALLRRYREKRLMKKALHEAARVGITIDLEHDPDVDGEPQAEPSPPRGRES
jgi:uncharacterized protein (DUF58 family)